MRAKTLNEGTYLQIYKHFDRDPTVGVFTILSGNRLYTMTLERGKPMRWKYEGKVDPERYTVNGTLVNKPSQRMIAIIQNKIKSTNESIEDVFKGKELTGAGKEMWHIIYPDLQNIGFRPREPSYSHGYHQIQFGIEDAKYISHITYFDEKVAREIWKPEAIKNDIFNEFYANVHMPRVWDVHDNQIIRGENWKALLKNILEEVNKIEGYDISFLQDVNGEHLLKTEKKFNDLKERKMQLEQRFKILNES